jgi:GNAT superfamily N-acetyltransferase
VSAAVAYRRGSARDRAALAGLLSGLSPDSAYARFQTVIGSGPPSAVLEALLPQGRRGGSLLAWDGCELVGHGLWVRIGESRSAEVGIVVTDGHQRRGIGTVLADQLVAAAAAGGIERIEVFSQARNGAVARMVARRSPTAEIAREGVTVTYAVALDGRERSAGARYRSWAA